MSKVKGNADLLVLYTCYSDEVPGLRDFEVNFLRLVDSLTQGTRVEINETGTSLRFHPGMPNGGSVEHDCGTGRAIGWFIEGILPMLPFAKKPTALALSGITNDDVDLNVDLLRTVTLPTLAHFGFGEGLTLTIKKRGAPPLGGGLVTFTCPAVRGAGLCVLRSSGAGGRLRHALRPTA